MNLHRHASSNNNNNFINNSNNDSNYNNNNTINNDYQIKKNLSIIERKENENNKKMNYANQTTNKISNQNKITKKNTQENILQASINPASLNLSMNEIEVPATKSVCNAQMKEQII